jgi:hypothetical protein
MSVNQNDAKFRIFNFIRKSFLIIWKFRNPHFLETITWAKGERGRGKGEGN